jgi:hypothetical protein
VNRWGDPRFRPLRQPERFAETARGPVAYRPVVHDGQTLGYLWASDVDGAAGWVECGAAGADGWNAGTPWLRRLSGAKAAGRTPAEALGDLAGLPGDERAGRVAEPGGEASLAALVELAEPAGPPAPRVEPAQPPLTGTPPAGLNTVQQAAYDYTRAPDVHNELLQVDDPPARLAELLADPARAAGLAAIFGPEPEFGDFVERYRLLDQAVSSPLPESLETLRGIADVTRVAGGVAGDVRALAGSTHTEPGYLSVSLGATPAYRTGCWLRLVAPKGTPSLWMGRRSHYPHERELILPRGLTVRIDDVYLRDGRVQIAATIVPAPSAE